MKSLLIIMSLLISSCSINGKYHQQKNIIIAKGQGGDRKASILLQDYFKRKKYLVEISDNINCIELSNLNNNYLLIGQSAVNEYIQQCKNTTNENIFLYSHILSPEIQEYLKNNPKIRLFTTESEWNLHKNVNIIPIPLALPTYLKQQAQISYENNKNIINTILKFNTIHLGGSYKNANEQTIIVDNKDFVKVRQKLNIKPEHPISVILHPRSFQDILNDKDKIIERLLSIANKNSLKNTYFFADSKLYDIIEKNIKDFKQFNIKLSPPYNGILYAINELNIKTKQYVSVDQYNAFADINPIVYGFLLKDNDKNQIEYLKYYKKIKTNENKNNKILKNFLKIVKK